MTDDELNKAFKRDVLTRALAINKTLPAMSLEETMAHLVIYAKRLSILGDAEVSGDQLIAYAVDLVKHIKHQEVAS